jgi:3-hydroxyacyl-[acyl-carrier-protein] dehydratase
VRFHLIDRVEECVPRESVRARKVTSFSEEYWEEADGELRMPPPFVLEAFCQAGTWLIMITTERKQRAALLSVGSVTWHRDVRPGDVLVMEGRISSFGDDTAVLGGTVTVDGETVLETEDVMCALIDADDLADADTTRRLEEMLTSGGSEDAE